MTANAVVAGPPEEPMSVGRLRVAEEHAHTCWQRLIEHAQGGRCTCHLGIGGSVHVLAGCVTGRMLYEEYWRAADLVRELSPKLEAGDFDGLDPAEERHLFAQAEAADPDPKGEAI